MDIKAPKQVVLHAAWCKACGICIAFCPRKALTANIEQSDDLGKPIWDADLCVRCTLCEQRCPDFAIYLEEVEPNG